VTPTRAVPGRSTTKGTSTRARVVDVAADLFDRHGYRGTSLQDVAVAAGLSKAAIYHHFRSKDEILVEIHEHMIDGIVGRQAERRSTEGLTAPDRLYALIADLTTLMAGNPTHLRVFIEQFRELPADARARIGAKRERLGGELRHILESGIADGELRAPGDLQTTVTAILGMCWTYHFFPGDRPGAPGDVAAEFTDLVLEGLTPRPAMRRRRDRT
jgi:AcrR family transcriptional regulator